MKTSEIIENAKGDPVKIVNSTIDLCIETQVKEFNGVGLTRSAKRVTEALLKLKL